MWQLIIKNSQGRVLREPVPLKSGTLSIGRGLECDVVLDSKLVSRVHASLNASGAQLLFRDEGSANGSQVDGKPASKTPMPIGEGARIEIADFIIELRRNAPARAEPADKLSETEVGGLRFTSPPAAKPREAEAPANSLADSMAGLLDQQIRGIQSQRDSFEQKQRSERENFEEAWRAAVTAARELRDRVGKNPKVLYFVIARDEREVAVKVMEKSRRGHCNLILSRKHPEKDAEMEGRAWLGVSGEEPQSFRDPRDALAELVRYLASMLA